MNSYRNILLIEDDPAVANSLIDGLEEANFQVVWKMNGQDGIMFARDHDPHLIIIDVRLPDTNGFDVCRRIRQLEIPRCRRNSRSRFMRTKKRCSGPWLMFLTTS
jgi:DNA-binding response OmpR family regulator